MPTEEDEEADDGDRDGDDGGRDAAVLAIRDDEDTRGVDATASVRSCRVLGLWYSLSGLIRKLAT